MKDIQTDLALVMQTEHGRRIIRHLVDISGCDTVTFTGDYGQDCYDRGRQALGQKLKNLAHNADFELYIQMLRDTNNG